MAQVKTLVGTDLLLHAGKEGRRVGAQLVQPGDSPDVISVDPGDEHLPLVIIDE